MMKSWRLCIKIKGTEIEFCCFFSQRLKTLRKVFIHSYSFEFNINQERAKCKRIFHKYLFPSYTVPVKVQTQQPYQLRTYAWCWSIPPKCSRYKIQMKTVFKTEVNVLFVFIFCRQQRFVSILVRGQSGEAKLPQLCSEQNILDCLFCIQGWCYV